ncbi:glucose-6-phosphate isomerase [Thermodesulfobacteriota bacterium]
MENIKLKGYDGNRTITKQKDRGDSKCNSFDSKNFILQNRLSLDITYIFNSPSGTAIEKTDIEDLIPETVEAHKMLKENSGNILDNNIPMTGWVDLPVIIDEQHLNRIKSLVKRMSEKIDAFVSLGIGGSYLGIESTFRALTHNYFNQLSRKERGNAPEIYFLGQNMDPDYFRDTLDMLEGKRIGVNVISKSGTTTETAIAFRIIRAIMEDSLGDDGNSLIIATTDKVKGALKNLADKKEYETFVVPDDIGGRFSVLSDVGLVGLAMANIDINEFVSGFKNMREITMTDNFWENPALVHAAVRHAAWLKRKKVEVIATNSGYLLPVARWMEQLFPESEGHDGHGMWISPSLYSEKLHANGQMVQDGERNILETFLLLERHDNNMNIPLDDENIDGLNFLPDNNRDMNYVNRKIIEGPAYAHYQGGVPNMTITIPERNAFNLGQFYYLMEKSVAVSGYLFGHNPFIQPGVEAYKKAMFALVGKPGYEDKARKIEEETAKLERIIV